MPIWDVSTSKLCHPGSLDTKFSQLKDPVFWRQFCIPEKCVKTRFYVTSQTHVHYVRRLLAVINCRNALNFRKTSFVLHNFSLVLYCLGNVSSSIMQMYNSRSFALGGGSSPLPGWQQCQSSDDEVQSVTRRGFKHDELADVNGLITYSGKSLNRFRNYNYLKYCTCAKCTVFGFVVVTLLVNNPT